MVKILRDERKFITKVVKRIQILCVSVFDYELVEPFEFMYVFDCKFIDVSP